ncbi:MAG: hypothetical protein IJ211_06835 [Campylobacter sp.]|nr:hypothetical protein [Campylobacter sp.]
MKSVVVIAKGKIFCHCESLKNSKQNSEAVAHALRETGFIETFLLRKKRYTCFGRAVRRSQSQSLNYEISLCYSERKFSAILSEAKKIHKFRLKFPFEILCYTPFRSE